MGGVIGAAASIGGSMLSASRANKSAKSARSAQMNAAGAGNAAQQREYEQTRADLGPYRDTGGLANSKLSVLMGLGLNDTEAEIRARLLERFTKNTYGIETGRLKSSVVDEPGLAAAIAAQLKANQDPQGGMLAKKFSLADYIADPGYQFRLDQGNKALAAKQSSTGNFYSGRALQEAADYNSGMASQEYGNAYGRYNTDQNNLYSRLGGLADAGRSATNTAASAGQNYANQTSQNYANAGSARANAAINMGNNWSQGLAGVMGSQYGGGGGGGTPFFSGAGGGGSGFWAGNTFFG